MFTKFAVNLQFSGKLRSETIVSLKTGDYQPASFYIHTSWNQIHKSNIQKKGEGELLKPSSTS